MKTLETIEAGHRVIIKRAMRSLGISPACYNADNLNRWAKSNPQYLAHVLVNWFEQAAKAWENGVNSGNTETMNQQNSICDRKRLQAESVLSLFGVKVDYPGLYPAFEYKGHSYYTVESLMKNI